MSDNWEDGTDYDAYMGRWSRKVARPFLDGLPVGPGSRWIEVGCGTGALTGMILDDHAPESVLGVEPADAFRSVAAARLTGARFVAGDAYNIPAPADSADAVVSALVLNFVPDLPAALAEFSRVLVPGGTAAAYVWDYAGHMQFIRQFWDAAIAVRASQAAKTDEGARFPMCRSGPLANAFENAGFENVAVIPIDITTSWDSFEDYWQPFTAGVGPAPGFCAALPEEVREALKAELSTRVPQDADGNVLMAARAWAVQGTV